MCLFNCKECEEKAALIKGLQFQRETYYLKHDEKIQRLKDELRSRNLDIKTLERKLKPYLEPRTKMVYMVSVDEEKYEVIADYIDDYGAYMGKFNTKFFLGEKLVADFSKVDKVIGFDYDSWCDQKPKKEEYPGGISKRKMPES